MQFWRATTSSKITLERSSNILRRLPGNYLVVYDIECKLFCHRHVVRWGVCKGYQPECGCYRDEKAGDQPIRSRRDSFVCDFPFKVGAPAGAVARTSLTSQKTKLMGRTNGIVPVENFFAVLGYALASFIVVAILLELFSFITLSIYRTFHPDPLASSRSPAYEDKEWADEFWREQKLLWGKARGSYVPFTVWGVRKWHARYINTDETQLVCCPGNTFT